MANLRSMLVQFMLLVLLVNLLVASSAYGYRIRADKKAMRNSLVRFGKRSSAEAMLPSASDPLAGSSAALYENGVGVGARGAQQQQQMMALYPMLGYRRFGAGPVAVGAYYR